MRKLVIPVPFEIVPQTSLDLLNFGEFVVAAGIAIRAMTKNERLIYVDTLLNRAMILVGKDEIIPCMIMINVVKRNVCVFVGTYPANEISGEYEQNFG